MGSAPFRTQLIEQLILDNVEQHGADLAQLITRTFGITRQAVNRYLKRLVANGSLAVEGRTRARVYRLQTSSWTWEYVRVSSVEEHVAWHQDLLPHLKGLPRNVLSALEFGFTEMFNNAVDHSEGATIKVGLSRSVRRTKVLVYDDGIGIFRKIMEALNLPDERHAVLPLAKGKLTTDPSRHSGEGIFFTSRIFDDFSIVSRQVIFSHDMHATDDFWRHGEGEVPGTAVSMSIANDSARTLAEVFSQFSSGDNRDFTRTVVPVKLAQYGSDRLISRSQGKRIVAGLEPFKTVVLDFNGVEMVGQGFADEIFRVFHHVHPEIDLIPINCNSDILHMIERVNSNLKIEGSNV